MEKPTKEELEKFCELVKTGAGKNTGISVIKAFNELLR